MTPKESMVIEAFRRALRIKTDSDDVELFGLDSATICATVDTLVASTDVPPTMSLRNAARKAVASCVSDFAAKGIRPSVGLVSVVLPKKITKSQINQLAAGTAEAAREFGIQILGGDTNEGNETAISVCIIGKRPRRIPRRGGAHAGDLIMTTGAFGTASVGLYISMSRQKLKGAKKFMLRARREFMRPSPPLEFCVHSSALFSSSMDSSDGLGTTLHEMASQSRVRFEIDALPIDDGLYKFASCNKLDALELVLYGGEEYATVFTCKRSARTALQRRADKLGIQLYEIGHVLKGRGVYATNLGNRFRVQNRGWKHL